MGNGRVNTGNGRVVGDAVDKSAGEGMMGGAVDIYDATFQLVPAEVLDPRALFAGEVGVADGATLATPGLNALLQRIAEQVRPVVFDMETITGRKQCASLAYKVAQSKVALDNMGKAFVADLKAEVKKVDEARRRAREFLDELKEEVRAPLTAWETAEAERVAAEKLAAEIEAAHEEALRENEWIDRQRDIERREAEIARVEAERRAREEAEAKARAEAEERARREREAAERKALEAQLAAQREQEAAAAREREQLQRQLAQEMEAARRADEAMRQAQADVQQVKAQQAAREAEDRAREQARQAEIERQAAEQRTRVEAASQAREGQIRTEAVADLISAGRLSMTAANEVFEAVAAGRVRHLVVVNGAEEIEGVKDAVEAADGWGEDEV